MQSEMLFSLLIVGLEKYTTSEKRYPFPPELQHAMNGLSLMMATQYPRSMKSFMSLMCEPLSKWWIPNGGPEIEYFDSRFSLLYDTELTDAAEEYLLIGNLRRVGITDLITLRDNAIMRDFVEQKRIEFQKALDDSDAERIEKEYGIVREFVTRNAYTHARSIRQMLPHPLDKIVSKMYSEATEQASRLLCKGSYWHCNECGMVGVDHEGKQHGLKQDVCKVRCPGKAGWEEITDDGGLQVLRLGIQRRTLIPGRIEMELYDWLMEYQLQNGHLVEIRLYPGVDRYDLRLRFSDGAAWAVDVKDYRLPTELGGHINSHPRPYDDDPSLQWSRAFYVVADDREHNHPGYTATAHREAGLISHEDVSLLTIAAFKHEVKQKCWELEG